MRTSPLPSRSAASRTAARARSSIVCSRQRRVREACVSRSCRASSGSLAATSLAKWKRVSSQKSARLKISWLSSMNRTGNRRPEISSSVRSSAATRARSMVFPRPRGATTRTCWHDGDSTFPRRVSSTMASSRFRTTNCAITSWSDWNVPGLNLRIGRSGDWLIVLAPVICHPNGGFQAECDDRGSAPTTSPSVSADGKQ